MDTTELRFVRFIEHNEWEGETWTLWLQVNGNETALNELHAIVDQLAPEDPDEDREFDLDMATSEPEFVVDKLVEYGGHGYGADHSKVVGALRLPPNVGQSELYKNKIAALFHATEEA